MIERRCQADSRSVAARVAAVIRAVATGTDRSVTDVARCAELPRSTTYRLLCGLVAGRLVERTADGRYQLDPLRMSPKDGLPALRAHIKAALGDLSDITGQRARFGVWNEQGVSYLDRSGSRGLGEGPTRPGVLPVHASAMGKALLAFAPGSELRRVLALPLPTYTSRTLTTPEALCNSLALARLHGTVMARGEWRGDEWAIAAPIFGPSGVVAALEIAGTGSSPKINCLTPALLYAARSLGRRLGDEPALLPSGTGATPLSWPIDPAQSGMEDMRGSPAKARRILVTSSRDSACRVSWIC
jgi:DNA-binding IclR family transcriptional regulator